MATLNLSEPVLTERQKQVHTFIVRHMEIHQRPPTQTEIARALRTTGRTGVLKHLKKLEEAGLVALEPGKSRGIALTIGPGVGDIDAPILDGFNNGLSVAKALKCDNDFATVSSNLFEMRPDYFVRAGLFSGPNVKAGDLAAIKTQGHADSGQMVLFDEEPRPLFRMLKHDGFAWWQVFPDEQESQRIDLKKLKVLGVVVGLIRAMRMREGDVNEAGKVVLHVGGLRRGKKKAKS
jgi:repressor LexA